MRWGWELNEMKWIELNHKWIDKMNPIHSIWCYCIFIKAILWIHQILISNIYDGSVFCVFINNIFNGITCLISWGIFSLK